MGCVPGDHPKRAKCRGQGGVVATVRPMRARARAADIYVIAAMLLAGVSGRVLDAGASLPGVHEAAAVRGGLAAWGAALAAAAVVGVSTTVRWARTERVTAAAAVAIPGQAAVFVVAEAVVRASNGRGPIDPDALLGASLQAGLAVVLLVGLTLTWAVLEHCRPLELAAPAAPLDRSRREAPPLPRLVALLCITARGPPMTAGT